MVRLPARYRQARSGERQFIGFWQDGRFHGASFAPPAQQVAKAAFCVNRPRVPEPAAFAVV
jgi:hypothetical protein